MSIRRHALFEAILARLSFGAVPVDGIHWLDPRDAAAPKPRRSAAASDEDRPGADRSPISLSLTRRLPRAQGK
jgi:hypothetical protein